MFSCHGPSQHLEPLIDEPFATQYIVWDSYNNQLHNLPQYCLVGSEGYDFVCNNILTNNPYMVPTLSTWCGIDNTLNNGLAIWVLKRPM
ncbi:hypothetical protein CR513_54748, partial [Mucuna pruriens]